MQSKLIKAKERLLTFLQMLKCLVTNIVDGTSLPQSYHNEQTLVVLNNANLKPQKIPKIIWMYWEEEIIPFCVQKMIDNIKRLHTSHEIHILNKDNTRSFLPELLFKGEMPIANKTDIIRLELLYRFGGIWIDCTTILRDNLNWIHEKSESQAFDIIGYYREKSTSDSEYPIIESWLLGAAPHNYLIKQWLYTLSPLKDLGNKAYFERIKKRPDYELIKQKISSPSYLLVYLAGQIALRKYKNFNLYLKKCEDSAFYVQEYYGWVNYKINYALCRLEDFIKHVPIVKLTSGDRLLIEMFRKFKLIKKNSTIGVIAQQEIK
ncbi:glycosyltransferase family 32 protein [Mucilaginibacter lappiensis]|uniref:Capsular polysaccharide synthesis protein n=1 Tax=Mucilaginibacter lappiensis TaxID=354630 RepID=A0A841JR45_9SPHI|nr:capsular polysaccharide synthesis protein [Mucilaginibacter lappiensis]MBB6130765.1 hypothetical protein [Mucilaginibacter lappiensis]